jgi:hypothetical protein
MQLQQDFILNLDFKNKFSLNFTDDALTFNMFQILDLQPFHT